MKPFVTFLPLWPLALAGCGDRSRAGTVQYDEFVLEGEQSGVIY